MCVTVRLELDFEVLKFDSINGRTAAFLLFSKMKNQIFVALLLLSSVSCYIFDYSIFQTFNQQKKSPPAQQAQQSQAAQQAQTSQQAQQPSSSEDMPFGASDKANEANTIIGRLNAILGSYNFINGDMNVLNGNANGIINGNKNMIKGDGNLIGMPKGFK